jgi:uncharacterized protein YjiS (DUF1127 family)
MSKAFEAPRILHASDRTGGFPRALLCWWDRFRAERRIRARARKLEALDDHILRDIGLSRSYVEHVARHGPETGRSGNVKGSDL